MIEGRTVLAVITARGGSKGLPGKNLRPLGGKPLLAWSIEAGQKSRYIDRLILSTDDPEIAATARLFGCEVPFLRPAELARDETPSAPVLLHALDSLEETYDFIVLLQPTVPLRNTGDIDCCLERCAAGAPACVSLTEPGKSPYWMYHLDQDGRMKSVIDHGGSATRRQDLPTAYALNGAVYVAETGWFRKHGGFVGVGTVGCVMPPERSIDIDTALDFQIAEILVAAGHQ